MSGRSLKIWLIVSLVVFLGCFGTKQISDNERKGEKEHKGSYACAACCIDGAFYPTLEKWVKKTYEVEYVDPITHAGLDGTMAEKTDISTIRNFKYNIGVSVNGHKSKVLVIAGHENCIGAPGDKNKHLAFLRQCKKVAEDFNFKGVKIVLVWINRHKEVQIVPEK